MASSKYFSLTGWKIAVKGIFEEHINLICEGCKKILDYRISVAVDQRDVTKKTGFSVTDARLEYYGFCRECSEDRGDRGGLSQEKRGRATGGQID